MSFLQIERHVYYHASNVSVSGRFQETHFFNHLALYLCHLVRKILQEYPCKTCTFLQGKDHLSSILQDLAKCKTMVLSLQKSTQVLQGYSCKIFLTGQLSHMQNYEHTYHALEHFDVCNA